MHKQNFYGAGKNPGHATCPKHFIIPLLAAAFIMAGMGNASASTRAVRDGASGFTAGSFAAGFTLFGSPLDLESCAMIRGGDVRMVVNAERNMITVNVIDNEYEARLGRIPPKKVFQIDVHNRVVDTIKAPYMPTASAKKQLGDTSGFTSKPEAFPEGNWRITDVQKRADKYGPYMIKTNATGMVDVYVPGVEEGRLNYIGRYPDTGYAIHSNTVPFEYSKSYGCLIVKQADAEMLASILAEDKSENPKAVQTIRVGTSLNLR